MVTVRTLHMISPRKFHFIKDIIFIILFSARIFWKKGHRRAVCICGLAMPLSHLRLYSFYIDGLEAEKASKAERDSVFVFHPASLDQHFPDLSIQHATVHLFRP